MPEQAEKEYSVSRSQWGGINKKVKIDSGEFSDGKMFIPQRDYIESAPLKSTLLTKGYNCVLGFYGAGDFVLVIYKDGTSGTTIYVDYVTSTGTVYTGTLKTGAGSDTDRRYVTQFNVYTNPSDPLTGTYNRKLLIFPDKKSMDYQISATFSLASFSAGTPSITYPVVHLSRLFGLDGERAYASEFNDYTGWNLDTADESLESNAWATTSQSNTKADGLFTAITVYDGHVLCFKDDFMHQINNTRNPFRIIDIGGFGCVNNECVAEAGGYLFFVSQDGVMLFGGGYPKNISENLDISDYSGSKLTAYGDVVYLYNGQTIYTFDVKIGSWGVRDTSLTVLGMASNSDGAFIITATGIYNLNGSTYSSTLGDSYFTTDLMALGVTDVKRLKRISLQVYLGTNAEVGVYAVTSSGDVEVGTISTTTAATKAMRVLMRKFANEYPQLKFKIKGYARIYQATFIYARSEGAYT